MSSMDIANEAVNLLRAGQTVYLRTNMGSCECGNTSGRMWVENGTLMAETFGHEKWQNAGPKPARKFGAVPGYGMGRAISLIAALYEGREPSEADVAFAFYGGTCVTNKGFKTFQIRG